MGNGTHDQPTVTCTTEPEIATAGRPEIPDVDPNDLVESDTSAQVVLKP